MAKAKRVTPAAAPAPAETNPAPAATDTAAAAETPPAAAPEPVKVAKPRRKPAEVDPDADPHEGEPAEQDPRVAPRGLSEDELLASVKPGQENLTPAQCRAFQKRLQRQMVEADEALTATEMRQMLRGRRPLRPPVT